MRVQNFDMLWNMKIWVITCKPHQPGFQYPCKRWQRRGCCQSCSNPRQGLCWKACVHWNYWYLCQDICIYVHWIRHMCSKNIDRQSLCIWKCLSNEYFPYIYINLFANRAVLEGLMWLSTKGNHMIMLHNLCTSYITTLLFNVLVI